MGFFSWKTQDTCRAIPNIYQNVRPTFTVYMVDPRDGTKYEESAYEGYGVFGGKDFYELLAELNGKQTREEGIRLTFSGEPYQSPILVEDAGLWEDYKGTHPANDPAQGFFYTAPCSETVTRFETGSHIEVCAGCCEEIEEDAPRYLHVLTDGTREWLCSDCAARLLGESLKTEDGVSYFG